MTETAIKKFASWNPWHGCVKISPGCANCYVYGMDGRYGKDAEKVTRNASFGLPIKTKSNGDYALPPGVVVYTCFTSDFFLKEADAWRDEAWEMISHRADIHFFIITKRIHRFKKCVPPDWGEGYENVTVCSTCENQNRADYRLPLLASLPIKRRAIVCAPLLERIDLWPYLTKDILFVSVGGESGNNARACDYAWINDLSCQCADAGVPFIFHQTGSKLLKDGQLYRIPKKLERVQASKAGLDTFFYDDTFAP